MTEAPPPPAPLRPAFGRRAAALVLGPPPPAALPEAVRRAVEADQRASEVLVCLAQIGALLFLAVFYTLTPKGFPADTPFEPVPWALSAYAGFTGLRLWLTLRDRLTPAVLTTSIFVDVAVLMVTIWSFHLQYDQPAAVYLKAPTLLYVFILIALRTLRLEARYVIVAGAVSALGWLALVAYSIWDADEMRITRDWATYMTSDAILIGAEIDKLISILVVTGVLSVAAVRARRLLIRSIAEAHAAAELSRFFAPEVAGEIREGEGGFRPGDAHERRAAVMMLDLRDFTGWAARLSPSGTIALLNRFHRAVVPAIQAHGGAIDKYLGDGVMATFGAARPSPTYAADALHAAEAAVAAVALWNAERAAAGEDPVGVGVGVACGPVLFGVAGDESRLEFTTIGEPANLAARLEKHCKAIGRPLVVTAELLSEGRAQGYAGAAAFEARPAERIEGVAAPADLAAFGPPALARGRA